MRDPSIHIARSRLRLLIHEWFKNNEISKPAEGLVIHLMERGANYALTSRMGLVDTVDKQKKRVSRVTQSPTEDALLFSNTLHLVRTQLKHRGITKYTPTHRDWEFIVELTNLANAFCENFAMSKRHGYAEYIRMFFTGRNGTFKLRQLKVFHETLMARYDAMLHIKEDPNAELTEKAHAVYVESVYEITQIKQDYHKVPEKYLCFVEVGRLCEEMKIKPEYYIRGNFEALASFSTSIPSPEQLITPNGKERAIKWLAENRDLVNTKQLDFSVIDEFKKRTGLK